MYIDYSTSNGVAFITLNRPEKFNSFIREMSLELQAALKKANEDSSKSIEDIAVNQLDVTTRIEKLLESGVVATKFATAT